MKRPNSKGVMAGSADATAEPSEWEMRPGGMLVQKRDPDTPVATGPLIKIKVSHGSFSHIVNAASHSTFGDVKKMLAEDTGLHPSEQRLLYKGKEKKDSECLDFAGLKLKAKLTLIEDPVAREKKIIEQRKLERIGRACQAVSSVQGEVDKLASQVALLQRQYRSGVKPAETDMLGASESLMRQLLKLDSIEADGDAKALRRTEVKRIQKLVESIDGLRGLRMPSDPRVVKATNWESFDKGVSSISTPPSSFAKPPLPSAKPPPSLAKPPLSSGKLPPPSGKPPLSSVKPPTTSAKITTNWETFD